MASRYWVGGGTNTNWNSSPVTNWSGTSGGSNNTSVPGTSDDVFFDSNSGALSSVISANISIQSLDCTGYIGNITHNSSVSLTITGSGVNFILVPGMTYTLGNSSTSATLFTGTSGNTLITLSGKSLGSVTFNGAGGKWTLQDEFISLGNGITLSRGTFSTNDKNLTAGGFNSNISATRVLNLGSSVMTLTGSFVVSNQSSLTFLAGTSTIIFQDVPVANSTLTAGTGLTFNNVTFSTTSNRFNAIRGSNIFNTLTFSSTTTSTLQFEAGGTQVVSNFIAQGSSGKVLTLRSVTNGLTWIISKSTGQVLSDYISLRDSTATGGARFYAGTHSVNVANNSGWNFSNPPTGAKKDDNGYPTMFGVSCVDGFTPTRILSNPLTNAFFVDASTAISVVPSITNIMDENDNPVRKGVSWNDRSTTLPWYVNPETGAVLIGF